MIGAALPGVLVGLWFVGSYRCVAKCVLLDLWFVKTDAYFNANIELILDPPSQPIIHGYVEGTAVEAGTVQKISCTSTGGNPLATLTWYKNDKKVRFTLGVLKKKHSAFCFADTFNRTYHRQISNSRNQHFSQRDRQRSSLPMWSCQFSHRNPTFRNGHNESLLYDLTPENTQCNVNVK